MLQVDTHIRALEAEFSTLLDTKVFGHQARFLASTDSTNTQAMHWANASAPEGALVLAENQTAGRGRHGRVWKTNPSSNLLFSLVLRPHLSPLELSLITVVASLALAETIDQFIAPVTTSIKWPNDILIKGKKCSGMLLESAISIHNQKTRLPIVLGIGVNINQDVFPAPITEKATSLLLETGQHIPRMAFLCQFLSRLESRYFSIEKGQQGLGHQNLLLEYQSRLAFMNEDTTLRFIGKNECVQGKIMGVTKTGALLLKTQDGLRKFNAGEVTSQGF